MTGTHPAEVIRRAAAAMRHHVEAVEAEMARHGYSWGSEADGTPDERYRRGVDDGLGGTAGVLASHWDLTTTRAVASWLENIASDAASAFISSGGVLLTLSCDEPVAVRAAYEIARAYLGEAPAQPGNLTEEKGEGCG